MTSAAARPAPPGQSPWIIRRKPSPSAKVRLFCFPYAGGGSLAYFRWPDELPDDVEVCAVQLPGRENRLSETAIDDLPRLTAQLVEALSPLLDREFAFFGHSFGALVSFALARALRRRGLALPRAIFASGRVAPSVRVESPLYLLGPDAFVAGVDARYGGIPPAILAEPEILALIVPTLRADLKIAEGYVHEDEPPLPVPIHAFGGAADPIAREAHLRPWERETSAGFALSMFPGGHFFVNEARAEVLRAVRAGLALGPRPGAGPTP